MTKSTILALVAGAVLPLTVFGETPAAPDAPELTKLLHEFLAGASRDDAAMHDRFWAEDLIYTGSSGRRIGKDEDTGLTEVSAPSNCIIIIQTDAEARWS